MLLRHICCVAHPHLVTPCVMYFTFMTSNLIIYSSSYTPTQDLSVPAASSPAPAVSESFAGNAVGALGGYLNRALHFTPSHPPPSSSPSVWDDGTLRGCLVLLGLPFLLDGASEDYDDHNDDDGGGPSQAEYPCCSFHFTASDDNDEDDDATHNYTSGCGAVYTLLSLSAPHYRTAAVVSLLAGTNNRQDEQNNAPGLLHCSIYLHKVY